MDEIPGPRPGEVALDAPIRIQQQAGWLLSILGPHFTCLCVNAEIPEPLPPGVKALVAGTHFDDPDGRLAERYAGGGSAVYLIRPDQHVAARYRQATAPQLHAAWRRSLALTNPSSSLPYSGSTP
jgi:3-(3-hydroxy-phenyl)propionate hydroxylase